MNMEMGYGLRKMVAGVLTIGILSPMLAGCMGGQQENTPPPGPPNTTQRPGLSRGQKTALLAGAAALYYLYQHRQKAPEKGTASGITGQLYRSESTGGIYYRDAQGKAHWVSPPKGGIRVPAEEAQSFQTQYRDEISRVKYKDDSQPLQLSPDELSRYFQ